jgi:hypothetical protein
MAHFPRRFLTQKTGGRPEQDAHSPAGPACETDLIPPDGKASFTQGASEYRRALRKSPDRQAAIRLRYRPVPGTEGSPFISAQILTSITNHPRCPQPESTPENASFSGAFSASENASRAQR